MAISRKKKEEIVSAVSGIAKKAEIIFFLDSGGLKASILNELRKRVKAAGGTFRVVKKRLAKRAFDAAGLLQPEVFDWKGSLSVVELPQGDAAEAAKTVHAFAKANDALKIIGAFLGKTFFPAQDVVALAKLPPREVLLGQLVGVISAPLRGLMTVLNGNTRKLVLTLETIKRSRQ